MKKKILIFLTVIVLIYALYLKKKNEIVKIPDTAIRFRILANSNSIEDQKIKENIKDKIQLELYNILKDSKNIKEARNNLNFNLNRIDTLLEKETSNLEYSYKINYGMNYFPKKEYKGVIYPEGNYESLLVTLGKGKGDNFWCVLFPPFCIMEAEDNNTSDVEYKFFIKELIQKYF